MSRLIDADALLELYADRLEKLEERYSVYSGICGALAGAMKLLETQSTIEPEQPKIIRCKDCMYAQTGDGVNHHLEFPDDTGICPCQCLEDDWYSWKPDDNFYCGHGKMKEGETDD